MIFKTLVGIRTGPLTRISLSLARVIKSPQTTRIPSAPPTSLSGQGTLDSHFSKLATFLEVKVIRILCNWAAAPVFSKSSLAAIFVMMVGGVENSDL